MMRQKKGIQLGQAFVAVLMLVMVAVLVIVCIYLLGSVSLSMLTPNTAATTLNESVAIQGTGANLSAKWQINGNCLNVTQILNATNNVAISKGNITLASGCQVNNLTETCTAGACVSPWRISYTYTYSAATNASGAADTTVVQFATYPALVGLIGVIVFIGIIIGVLVASFAFGRSKA